MKKSTLTLLTSILGIFITLFIFSSCNKKFDVPPAYQTPNITANTTIAKLKSLYQNAGTFQTLSDTSTMVISGIVVADDYSGAFYKEIVVQDSTGAIVLLLDNKYLYLNYPQGRQVFVYCHGLTLSNDKYNGYITLGNIDYSTPNVPASIGIPAANIPQYVIQGSTGNPVVPVKANITALTTNLQDPKLGAFIELDSFEFPVADTSVNWGDTTPAAAYVTIPCTDCFGNVINYNTSSYANFAGFKVPNGHGNIRGIYSFSSKAANGTTRQLLLRDTTDAELHSLRCNGTLNPPTIIYNGASVFSTIVTKTQLNLAGWLNIPEVGGVYYQGYVGTAGSLASITAYKAASTPVTSWLISPLIAIPAGTATPPYLSFGCTYGYANGATFGVYVSTNYNGSSLTPSTATWVKLPYTAPNGTTNYPALISSGNLDLSAYAGKSIYIGFRYDGTATQNTTFEFGAPLVAY